MADLTVYQRFILFNNQPAAGASVEIRNESNGAISQIFDDKAGTVVAANPMTADAAGQVRCYIREGVYQVTATSGVDVAQERNVPIGNQQERDTEEKIVEATTDFIIQQDDIDQTFNFNSPLNQTATFAAGIEIGFMCSFVQKQGGLLSFAATGGEVIESKAGANPVSGGVSTTQTALKIDANTWLIMGELF